MLEFSCSVASDVIYSFYFTYSTKTRNNTDMGKKWLRFSNGVHKADVRVVVLVMVLCDKTSENSFLSTGELLRSTQKSCAPWKPSVSSVMHQILEHALETRQEKTTLNSPPEFQIIPVLLGFIWWNQQCHKY